MSPAVAIIVLVLLGLVVLLVGAPLRAAGRGERGGGDTGGARRREVALAESPGRRELEAAREAKYREIRDAELDFRTGKLSREDFEAIDAELRSEAISILDRLDGPAEGEPRRASG